MKTDAIEKILDAIDAPQSEPQQQFAKWRSKPAPPVAIHPEHVETAKMGAHDGWAVYMPKPGFAAVSVQVATSCSRQIECRTAFTQTRYHQVPFAWRKRFIGAGSAYTIEMMVEPGSAWIHTHTVS